MVLVAIRGDDIPDGKKSCCVCRLLEKEKYVVVESKRAISF